MALNKFMHPRNIYKTRPDFNELASVLPEFGEFAKQNERGKLHIDFKDTGALRSLTKALLKKDFGLTVEIPENCLIPTVPQRLNYILWIEDLLKILPSSNEFIKGIDIGTGPCCIFPLLGAKKNGWRFLATETEEQSLIWARKNIEANSFQSVIELRKTDKDTILKDIISSGDETFDFCLCNPPFFEDFEELNQKKSPSRVKLPKIDFKESEVVVPGGEVSFVRQMIEDSFILKDSVKIYTSMLGKKKSLLLIKNELKQRNVKFTCTEFCQGNTMRWGVAWTFANEMDFTLIDCPKRKKKGKAIIYDIPQTIEVVEYTVNGILKHIKSILREFGIMYGIKKENKQNVYFWMKSKTNTWSHQRRRKRMMLQKKASDETNGAQSITKEVEVELNSNIIDSTISINKQEDMQNIGDEVSLNSNSKCVKRKLDELNSSKRIKTDEGYSETNKISGPSSNGSSNVPPDPPLLLCDVHLRKVSDIISLEMNCSENCNRQSMHEILQLLKNRIK